MTLGAGIRRTPLPCGFRVSGVNCGVRRYRPDLGIILSDRDAVGAAVFTQNKCKAAPVLYSKALVPSSRIRAILTNSGQANAATGSEGVKTNLQMVEGVARQLRCDPSQVLSASTGMIGVPLEVEKIVASLPELIARAVDHAEPFALAILTTDLIPKTASIDVALSGGMVRITGVSKGSGMIHPNMATMLGYLLTDAVVSPAVAQSLVRESADLSFNMISVDGETSTNDCVFLLANGASQVAVESKADLSRFKAALVSISQVLAQAIARDGEGSTKLIEVDLQGAPTKAMAREAARGITVSPLIKTAIHGEDPNWGRILARLGSHGVPEHCLANVSLAIQGIKVMEQGMPVLFDREDARQQLKRDTIQIAIELNSGKASAKAWGCDLSRKYVEINAEYST